MVYRDSFARDINIILSRFRFLLDHRVASDPDGLVDNNNSISLSGEFMDGKISVTIEMAVSRYPFRVQVTSPTNSIFIPDGGTIETELDRLTGVRKFLTITGVANFIDRVLSI